MNYLIRKPVIGSPEEFQDIDIDAPLLTLGSDTNHAIKLAEITAGSISIKAKNASAASFKCTGKLTLQHGQKQLKKGKLVSGEKYQLGVYDLEVINAPAGFDFALSLKKSNRIQQQTSYTIKHKNKAPIRSLAYLAFISIVLFFLILPVLSLYHPFIEQTLESSPLPTDQSWSSGPVAMAHNIPEISNQCTACHQQPFEKVADTQCMNCHKDMGQHIAETNPLNDQIFHGFMCQNCHKEHNEPARITRNDDALCIDCHAQIESLDQSAGELVENVHGFTANSHPKFKLSLLQADGNGAAFGWVKSRHKYNPAVQLKEQSNLKFSHEVHLNPDKVQDQMNSQTLTCETCHQLQHDGKQFEPITMDKDCRSCHQLTFDVFNPDIELPHGNLRAANVALQAHYIREFTDPTLRARRAKLKPRRIPGKNMSQATCVGSGLACGQAEAWKEAEFQFSNTGCITCHEVQDNGGSELLNKWFVQPVKINNDWYVKSQFDHKSHLSVSSKKQQEICLSCHDVSHSDSSSDIAIPQQDNCLTCHQQDSKHSVELPCISCHVFHFTDE